MYIVNIAVSSARVELVTQSMNCTWAPALLYCTVQAQLDDSRLGGGGGSMQAEADTQEAAGGGRGTAPEDDYLPSPGLRDTL